MFNISKIFNKKNKPLPIEIAFKKVVEKKMRDGVYKRLEFNRWIKKQIKEAKELNCDLSFEEEQINEIERLACKLQNDFIDYLDTEKKGSVSKIKSIITKKIIDEQTKDKANALDRCLNSKKIITELQKDLLDLTLLEKIKTINHLYKLNKKIEKKYGYTNKIQKKYPTVKHLIEDLILMEVHHEGLSKQFVNNLKTIYPFDRINDTELYEVVVI